MTAQTTYSRFPNAASPGTPYGDQASSRRSSLKNDEGATLTHAGIGLVLASEGNAELPGADSEKLAGILMNDFSRTPAVGGASVNGFADDSMLSVLEEGMAYVQAEETVAVGDPVYCRHTTSGGNTVLGKFRNDSDSGKAFLVRGAYWVKGGGTTNAPVLCFSRVAQEAARSLDEEQLMVELTAAAEDTNSITVSGAVKTMDGDAVTSAKEVVIYSLAVTADKGDLSDGGDGTLKKAVNPATGANVAWMTTTAAGLFQVAVANDAAEDTLVWVLCDGALVANLKLTFA